MSGMKAKFDVAVVHLRPFGVTVSDQSPEVRHNERLIPIGIAPTGDGIGRQRSSATPLSTRFLIQSARWEHCLGAFILDRCTHNRSKLPATVEKITATQHPVSEYALRKMLSNWSKAIRQTVPVWPSLDPSHLDLKTRNGSYHQRIPRILRMLIIRIEEEAMPDCIKFAWGDSTRHRT